jgi:hypothetical protein
MTIVRLIEVLLDSNDLNRLAFLSKAQHAKHKRDDEKYEGLELHVRLFSRKAMRSVCFNDRRHDMPVSFVRQSLVADPLPDFRAMNRNVVRYFKAKPYLPAGDRKHGDFHHLLDSGGISDDNRFSDFSG